MRGRTTIALAVCLLLVPLVGCLGSETPTNGTDTDPTNQTANNTSDDLLPETLSGLQNVSVATTDGSGTGIWIDENRDLVLSANGNAGLQIFDVRDPDNPTRVGALSEIPQDEGEPQSLYARDADLMERGNRSYAILAGSGAGIHVVDITNASNPQHVVTASEYSSHNVAVVPGTPYVYDATAVGIQQKLTDAIIPVLDLSNLTEPTWTTIPIPAQVSGIPTQSDGCHDVVVRQDLGRAYCAGGGSMYQMGGGESFIWDISEDPLSPEWLGVVDNPSIIYHHQAIASEDGNLLFINDENIAPNCQRISAGDLTVGQTTAAMWVYNISDPTLPVLEGYLQAESPNPTPDPEGNCGSHFGDLIDGRDALSWAWYEGGILLIDVSDPANPTILDQEAPVGATWDARYHDGHVYGSSGDLQIFQIE